MKVAAIALISAGIGAATAILLSLFGVIEVAKSGSTSLSFTLSKVDLVDITQEMQNPTSSGRTLSDKRMNLRCEGSMESCYLRVQVAPNSDRKY